MQDLLGPGPGPDDEPDAVPLVVVGFSAPADMAALATYLGLRGPVLADPDRVLYRLLGLPRAPVWQVYSPSTLARYARAAFRGTLIPRPGAAEIGAAEIEAAPREDTRQLGGDALVVDGVVVRRWRPRTPADRVDPTVLITAARLS